LFVVIDQIEQAYTSEDAGHAVLGEAARELDTFASAIGSLFADDATRPRGRLVLSFRKEWLSEVKGALEAHRCREPSSVSSSSRAVACSKPLPARHAYPNDACRCGSSSSPDSTC
jgi:hypothetical protein